MISVGIDVSKGKSTVCILRPYGELVKPVFEVTHAAAEQDALTAELLALRIQFKTNLYLCFLLHAEIM